MPSISPRPVAAALGLLAAAACGGTEARDDAPAAAVATPTAAAAPQDSLLAVADSARIQGAPGAPVWMVVVSDFQCPYCARWHEQSYDELVRDYVRTGKIRIAYLHYPLPNHPHAMPAAEWSTCAGLQGKFWEMHDAIFESVERWNDLADATPVFESLAAGLGLDVAALRQCVASDVTVPLIQSDYERARRAGVTGTPTFFIGSRVIGGLGPTSAYRAAIDSALADAAAGRTGAPQR